MPASRGLAVRNCRVSSGEISDGYTASRVLSKIAVLSETDA